MISAIIPLLDSGISVSTEINIWSIILPVIITALTAATITLGTKLLDRKKTTAEENKISAEEKKLRIEAGSLENEEWRKLYAETKLQYASLKKDSEEQIEKLKKESGEQMDFLKKQISLHSETLDLQQGNFETQEETIQQLKNELEVEKTARLKLETIIKNFRQWVVRNRAQLEEARIELPVLEVY